MHRSPVFRIQIMIQSGKYHIMPYQATIAQFNTTLILKMTTGIDEYILTYLYILSEICVERRKNTERRIYRLSEQT